MSRVLLDENMPFGLARLIAGHDVRHVTRLGWDGIENGDLLPVAEQAGFDVLVTADKNLRYQQNLAGRTLALVILSTNRWADVRRSARRVNVAIDEAERGGFHEVDLKLPERARDSSDRDKDR